jgi:hypothetical protein
MVVAEHCLHPVGESGVWVRPIVVLAPSHQHLKSPALRICQPKCWLLAVGLKLNPWYRGVDRARAALMPRCIRCLMLRSNVPGPVRSILRSAGITRITVTLPSDRTTQCRFWLQRR